MMVVVLSMIFLSVAAMAHEEMTADHQYDEDCQGHSVAHSERGQYED